MAGRPPCGGGTECDFRLVEAKLRAAGGVVDEPRQVGVGGDPVLVPNKAEPFCAWGRKTRPPWGWVEIRVLSRSCDQGRYCWV
jgi:hypothetical protein